MTAAMVPLPPARLSTTTCWPRRSASFCPNARETMSVTPPGAKPTIKRMGLFGYGVDSCDAVRTNPAALAASPRAGLRLTSPAAPGAKPAIKRMGLVGYSWAVADCVKTMHASSSPRTALLRRAARQPRHLETVGDARIASLAGETPDRIHAADINVIAVVHETVVVMKPHDFADHEVVGAAAKLDNLHELALHRDRRFLDARRAHDTRWHRGESCFLELVDFARVVDRADIHLVLDRVAHDVHDELRAVANVGHGIFRARDFIAGRKAQHRRIRPDGVEKAERRRIGSRRSQSRDQRDRPRRDCADQQLVLL